jgi:GTPase SAR1 family protein
MIDNSVYHEISCLSVAVLGCADAGKTSIINRVINNNFVSSYEPSMDIIIYNTFMSLNDDTIKNKRYIILRFEDL